MLLNTHALAQVVQLQHLLCCIAQNATQAQLAVHKFVQFAQTQQYAGEDPLEDIELQAALAQYLFAISEDLRVLCDSADVEQV